MASRGPYARSERALVWIGAVALSALGFALAIALIAPLPERLTERDSTIVTYADGQLAHVFLAPDERWRIGVELSEIDPRFVRALIALEDARFFWHAGVDPIAIVRAVGANWSAGEVREGASTITMQLVRVLEPRPRTFWSKAIESARAFQLEVRLSKSEILANYLRFAPYGRNIEGLDAASLTYFGHRARALDAAEIATLLAIPQAPTARYPSEANAERLAAGRAQVARDLLAAGVFADDAGDIAALRAIEEEDLPWALRPMPREIRHAAVWLRARYPERARIETTLDRVATREAERVLSSRRDALRDAGVFNGAVVLVDHEAGEVRALVGNLDFHDEHHAGQIASFDVARSTGSLIKPLLLGLGIERGLAHPEMMAEDTPYERAGWRPMNFEGEFSGLVPYGEALRRSLNMPFVRLAERLGPGSVLDVLERARFAHLEADPGHYGAGLAIGGVEATPLEVAGLWSMIAAGGAAPVPRLLSRARPAPSVRLFGDETSWLVRTALEGRARPDRIPHREDERAERRIAWKTGTSNAHRDAWSVGSSGSLTALVWLGNLSAAPSTALVGQSAASPIMFDLLGRLPAARASALASGRPAGLIEIEVCAFSGKLRGPHCPRARTVEAPEQSAPAEICSYHDAVEVDRATGLRVSPSCRAGRATEIRAALRLPERVARYANISGAGRLPDWAPGCDPSSPEARVRVHAPRPGEVVFLIPGLDPRSQRVPLRAEAGAGGELHWFVDGAHLASVGSGEPAWWTPQPGDHEIVVVDASGRRVARRLVVRAR